MYLDCFVIMETYGPPTFEAFIDDRYLQLTTHCKTVIQFIDHAPFCIEIRCEVWVSSASVFVMQMHQEAIVQLL